MAVDLSAVSFFIPLLSFLVVFIVGFAVFSKSGILGGSKWVQLFVSFLIATIFISVGSAREYVQNVIPWAVVLIISLFLVLMFTGFVGKPLEKMVKPIGMIFVVLLFIVFIVAGIFVFSSSIVPYLPGNLGYEGGSDNALRFFDWLYSPRVAGAILLLVVSALVSWVLVRVK